MADSINPLKYGGEALPALDAKRRQWHRNGNGKVNKTWLRTRKRIRRRLLEGRGH